MKKRFLAIVCVLSCLWMLCACNVTVKTDEGDKTVNISTDDIDVSSLVDDTATYVTNTYNITDDFESISVAVDVDDVTLLPSQDDVCAVECVEDEIRLHTVEVVDNTLTVKNQVENFESDGSGLATSVIIYLPKDTYKNISFEISTGSATVENIGCENLDAELSIGDLKLSNVVASGDFSIEVATGSITFNDCDAANITATTSLGDITGTLLSGKTFTATSSLGDVSVPENSGSGTCSLDTSLGSIQIEVK